MEQETILNPAWIETDIKPTVLNPLWSTGEDKDIYRNDAPNDFLYGERVGALGNENISVSKASYDSQLKSSDEREGLGQKMLLGCYRICKRIYEHSSEAELYLCERDGKDYIAKVYRRTRAMSQQLLSRLAQINSSFIVKPVQTGEENGHLVEILPYFSLGSMKGKRYSFEQLKYQIIPRLNEGIHALHENGIFHKDLKPANIMVKNQLLEVAIIDFGISRTLEGEGTVIISDAGLTPEYAAPETFRNVFFRESDYYSLGITIYELFLGAPPSLVLSAQQMEEYAASQKLPLPDQMPKELQNLIHGLTYHDITRRKQVGHPDRRWTYEQVSRWCQSLEVQVPGQGSNMVWFEKPSGVDERIDGKVGRYEAVGNSTEDEIIRFPFPYSFMRQQYYNLTELTKAFVENWSEGKKQLVRGILSGFLKSVHPELAGRCMDAEEQILENKQREDEIFLDLMYELSGRTCTYFFWKGFVYTDLLELGEDILKRLQRGDEPSCHFFAQILSMKGFAKYSQYRNIEKSEAWEKAVRSLETEKIWDLKLRHMKSQLFFLGYLLTGKKTLLLWNQNFHTVEEFFGYLRAILKNSYDEYERLCQELVEEDGNLMLQLECWLMAHGKREWVSMLKSSGMI